MGTIMTATGCPRGGLDSPQEVSEVKKAALREPSRPSRAVSVPLTGVTAMGMR